MPTATFTNTLPTRLVAQPLEHDDLSLAAEGSNLIKAKESFITFLFVCLFFCFVRFLTLLLGLTLRRKFLDLFSSLKQMTLCRLCKQSVHYRMNHISSPCMFNSGSHFLKQLFRYLQYSSHIKGF